MTAPPRLREIRRILLPIVGATSEQAAIDYAATLALALHASITLAHVAEIPNAMVGIVPGASIAGDLDADRIASTVRLDNIAQALAARGVTDTRTIQLVAPGSAAALIELVERERFDLVVMATHARTGIARALLGSVTEHLVRHAPCPVMTVHSS